MDISVLKDNIALLIPMLIVQVGLIIAALISIFKHNAKNKIIWIIVAIAIPTIGALICLIMNASSKENHNDDNDE